MGNYTKGPWIWEEDACGLRNVEGDWILHYVPYEGMWIPTFKESGRANALLLSSAPELLAALEAMVESYEHEASAENPALIAARAAIAKATGESA